MPCQPISGPGGMTGFICSRGPRAKPCCICGKPSSRLCDFPLRGAKAGRTCDRPLCAGCAVHVGPDRDLCPAHAGMEGP